MRVYTKVVMAWDELRQQYVTLAEDSFEYTGPVALCCGATSGQKDIGQKQTGFFDTMIGQAKTIFGDVSSVFKDIYHAFSPIVAAGPNQHGFAAPVLAGLKSQAITNTAQAYKNASQAVNQHIAAAGGGNMALPGGAAVGAQISLAQAAAEEQSKQLSNINLTDYQMGRENFFQAAGDEMAAPGVFNPATSSAGAATNAGQAAADTQNQIAAANNSWVNATIGALGSVAGAAATGGMSNMGKGVGFLGQNAPAPGH